MLAVKALHLEQLKGNSQSVGQCAVKVNWVLDEYCVTLQFSLFLSFPLFIHANALYRHFESSFCIFLVFRMRKRVFFFFSDVLMCVIV